MWSICLSGLPLQALPDQCSLFYLLIKFLLNFFLGKALYLASVRVCVCNASNCDRTRGGRALCPWCQWQERLWVCGWVYDGQRRPSWTSWWVGEGSGEQGVSGSLNSQLWVWGYQCVSKGESTWGSAMDQGIPGQPCVCVCVSLCPSVCLYVQLLATR